jgi:hypothetical protein
MKNIILIILFTFCLYSCTDKKEVKKSPPIDYVFNRFELSINFIDTKSKLSEQDLKGNVKYISELQYEATYKFGEIEKSRFFGREYSEFDEFGNKKLGRYFFVDDDIKYVNDYDANNNIIETNYYESDTILVIKIKYKYDLKGNEIEKCIYKRGNIIVEKKIFQYNSNNDIIEENCFDSNNKLSSKIKYKYDIKGNKIEESNYNSDGSLFKKTTSEYDINNREIETNFYQPNNESEYVNQKNTHKYDGKGNLIESKYCADDGLNCSTSTFKHNENGDIIEHTDFSLSNMKVSLNSYKFEYDKNGNWIKKIIFYNDEPKTIIERKIKYY